MKHPKSLKVAKPVKMAPLARLGKVEAYLARTQDSFAQSIEAAKQLGTAGRGVMAGPVKRQSMRATG